MQASQSNNASDLLTLGLNANPKPDATLSRIFPSPFSAPIQAARRYIERQKADVWQADDQERSLAEPGAFERGGQPAAGCSEDSRERDRRLERSLYEGHSIEAGLNFEDAHGSDAAETTIAGRASVTESDGSEPLFQYTVPGPLPDPEVVRGVISRLARESELRGGLRSRPAGRSVELAEVAEMGPSAIRPVQSLNFGEVARRVWEASVAQPDGSSLAGAGSNRPPDRLESDALPAKGAAKTLGVEDGKKGPLSEEVRSGPGTGQAGPPTVPVQQVSRPALLKGAMPRAVESVTGLQKTLADVPCDVEAQPALAHDACNLLSALTLYSELLGSPGVLEDQYRHYAQELKLLAVRSRVLIDRLLQGAVTGKEEAAPLRSPTGAAEAADASSGHGPDVRTADVRAADVRAADVPTAGAGDAGHPRSDKPLGTDPADTVGAGFEADTDSSSLLSPAIQGIFGSEGGAEPAETAQIERATSTNESIAVGSLVTSREFTTAQRATGDEARGTNLADLLMRWGSLLSTMAQGTLEVVFGPGSDKPVPAGAEALERILVNLVRNARAATLEGGAIRIGVGVDDPRSISGSDGKEDLRAAELAAAPRDALAAHQLGGGAGGDMVLTVDDSGCGMTDSQVRRIFGADVSCDEAAACLADLSGRRRGLGLQIVRELVAASGGALSIQSWPGRGTRIEIRWPLPVASVSTAPVSAASVSAIPVLTVPVSAMSAARAAAEEVGPQAAEEFVETAPAVLHAVQPIAAVIPPVTSQGAPPVEITQGRVGPDGFSEAELRAMILRLHRSGPLERSPLSRRLSSRPAGTRAAEREFGWGGNAIHSVQGYGVPNNDPAQEDSAAKGAIAC